IAFRLGDALHEAVFVELDDGFREIEIDRPAALALAIENGSQVAHALEFSDQVLIARAQTDIAFKDGVDGGVSHALGRANHALVDLEAEDVSLMIDFHGAGENEAIELGTETTEVSREFDRQHGDGAIGEINRGPTQARFAIDGGIIGYVLSDVCDMD